MRKISIDAVTLRYFPGVGNRWLRMFIAALIFVPYVYLVFPFRRLTDNPLNSLLLIILFGLSVLADSSFLLMDVSDEPLANRKRFEGEIIAFQEGRGVGGSKGFVVENSESKLFKALSVRSQTSLANLRKLQGEHITVFYQTASGLFTNWNLPVHILSADESPIYDYSNYQNWFSNPLSAFDRFLVQAYIFYIAFLGIVFPAQFISRLITKEGEGP